MKLGSLLIRDGVITLDQLEGALRRQVLFGGDLGRNLVELGHLALDPLAMYLGRALGLPPAAGERFAAADPAARARVPAAVARRLLVFPLGLEGEPPALAIAVSEGWDAAAAAELERVAGLPLRPYVASELRIRDWVDRVYGPVAEDGPPPPRQAAPAGPRALRIGPRGGPRGVPPPVSLAAALAQLEGAPTRDEIAEGVLRFARGRLDAAVLFLVRDERAQGWRGLGIDPAALERLVLPLTPPSVLASAWIHRAPWRGRPDPDGVPAELRALAPGGDGEAVVVPVLVGPHLVNLLWAPARPQLDEAAVDGLASVAGAAGEAYARLIAEARDRVT